MQGTSFRRVCVHPSIFAPQRSCCVLAKCDDLCYFTERTSDSIAPTSGQIYSHILSHRTAVALHYGRHTRGRKLSLHRTQEQIVTSTQASRGVVTRYFVQWCARFALVCHGGQELVPLSFAVTERPATSTLTNILRTFSLFLCPIFNATWATTTIF
jgi:hypothetical protein